MEGHHVVWIFFTLIVMEKWKVFVLGKIINQRIKENVQMYRAEFGDNLSSRNRDMVHDVSLECCDLKRSNSSMEVK